MLYLNDDTVKVNSNQESNRMTKCKSLFPDGL